MANLRPYPTRLICLGFRILNMFNMESRQTITESVVESAYSGIESADSTANSAANPLKIDSRRATPVDSEY